MNRNVRMVIPYFLLGHTQHQLPCCAAGEAWLAAWYAAATAQLQSASARDVANSMWALARIGASPPPALLAGLLAAARRSARINTQDLANIFWALGALGSADAGGARAPSPDEGEEASSCSSCDASMQPQASARGRMQQASVPRQSRAAPAQAAALLSVAGHMLGAFKPQELSSIAWGCAAAGWHPGEHFVHGVADAAQRQWLSLSPQQLGNLAFALARLHHVPQPAWRAAFLEHSARQLQRFAAADCAQCLYALACWLPHRPAGSDTSDAHAANAALASWLAVFYAAINGAALQSFTAQELANSARSLAILRHATGGVPPPPGWRATFAAAVRARLADFSPACAVDLLSSAPELALPLGRETCEALLLESLSGEPGHLSAGDMLRTAYAAAVAPMQGPLPAPWMDAFCSRAAELAPGMAPAHVARLLAATAALRGAPSAGWLAAVLPAATSAIPMLPPDQLRTLLGAVAALLKGCRRDPPPDGGAAAAAFCAAAAARLPALPVAQREPLQRAVVRLYRHAGHPAMAHWPQRPQRSSIELLGTARRVAPLCISSTSASHSAAFPAALKQQQSPPAAGGAARAMELVSTDTAKRISPRPMRAVRTRD